MNAGVHTSVGIASSLLVMQPKNLTDLALTVGVASIGAIIPDIDCNGESKMKKEFRKACLLAASGLIGLSIYSYVTKTPLVDFSSKVGLKNILAIVVFFGFCVFGYMQDHRTFTHWAIALPCFTLPIITLIGWKYGLAFGVAMLSHQLIDMLNKRKITWLFPLPFDFALYICKASSKLSTFVGFIANGISFAFIINFLR